MVSAQRLSVPGWLTLNEASRRLGVTRQAVGQIAMRLGWERGCLDKVVLVREVDVEILIRMRKPAGPAPPGPAPDAQR